MTDERGSVMAEVSASSWRAEQNTYDEYGQPGGTGDTLYGYAGQLNLTGDLTHNRNRAYHSGLGRFLQADPIGQNGGLNLYAYVGADPMNFVDPLGLVKQPVCVPTKNKQQEQDEACVYIDTSTGLPTDILRNIGTAFGNFIRANDGMNISAYGKKVLGTTGTALSLIQALTQFAGAAISMNGTQAQRDAWATVKWVSVGATSTGAPGEINTRIGHPDFAEMTLLPSLSKEPLPGRILVMAHESFHLIPGFGLFAPNWRDYGYRSSEYYRHSAMNCMAVTLVRNSGLGDPSLTSQRAGFPPCP